MTWSKFDDKARSHPKVRKAGNAAAGLWWASIIWSNEYHTDGFIPAEEVRTVQAEPISSKEAERLAKRLVDAKLRPDGKGLWEEVPGGYQIHDFLDWNPSAEDERQRKKAERRRKADSRRRPLDVPPDVQPDSSSPSERTDAGRPTGQPADVRAPSSRAYAGAPAPAGASRPVPSRPVQDPPQAPPEAGGGLLEDLARAYADGIAEAAGEPWRMPDANVESAIVRNMLELHRPQLRGPDIARWVKRSAATYRRMLADKAEFQKGFRPSKWAEWLNAGGEKMQRRAVLGKPPELDVEALRSRPEGP